MPGYRIPCRVGDTLYPAVNTALKSLRIFDKTTGSERQALRERLKAEGTAHFAGHKFELDHR